MARNYGPVLSLAEDLQDFRGYLDSEDMKRQAEVRGNFTGAVRVFVYALYKESPDHGGLGFSVSGDLNRIAATGDYSQGAIDEARAALIGEIEARSRNHPAIRFIIRWGPPAIGLAAAAAYIYYRTRGR